MGDLAAGGADQGKSPKRKKPDGDDSDLGRVGITAATQTASSPEQTKETSWVKVVSKNRNRPRPKLIVGKYDTQDGASSLVGGSATADIVVSGIRASLDAKDRLVAHLKCPFGKNDGGIVIEPDDVQQLTKDSNKKTLAFKVTIKIEDKKTVFTDLFWPPKTCVRNFIPFRS